MIDNSVSNSTTPDPRHVRAVEQAIRLMQGNLERILSIDELACAAAYSKFHFSRLFKRVTGLPPRRFHTKLRLEEAARLLRSTDLLVTEISFRVGYDDSCTFRTEFKKVYKLSPTAYRRSLRKGAELPVDKELVAV